MKKRALFSMFLAFLMIFSFSGQSFAEEHEARTELTEDGRVQITLEFEDAEEAAWAVEYIGKMKSKNVLAGYQDGTFRPNQNVNRAEAIVTAVRLMGLEEQAKQKSADTRLHFKDANLVDKQYPWAKGYILVALEHGLFDTSEDAIKPNEPASRIWVASLLVRALGLQSEALGKMTVAPGFSDASSIPAGAVGYINVAAERGIVSGYPDNTFQPNRKVTRAEMAAFLDRTNDGLLEEAGAITVTGTVKAIEFRTVTDSVSTEPNGTITIESFNGDSLSYGISSDLLVQYQQRFITADQLIAGDAVSFVVKETQVVEANLLSKDAIDETISGINELKIEVEFGDDEKYKLKYKNKKGKIDAEIEEKFDDDKNKSRGKEAAAAAEAIIKQLAITPEMSKEELVNKVLAALNVEPNGFSELEIEIKFSNGQKVEIEVENEEFDRKANNEEGYNGIQKFELKLKTYEDEKIELKYENKDGNVKAEVKSETENGKEELKGQEAVAVLEELLDKLSLTGDMRRNDVLEAILSEFNVDEDNIKEFEVKVEFTNDREIEVELEGDEDNDD